MIAPVESYWQRLLDYLSVRMHGQRKTWNRARVDSAYPRLPADGEAIGIMYADSPIGQINTIPGYMYYQRQHQFVACVTECFIVFTGQPRNGKPVYVKALL